MEIVNRIGLVTGGANGIGFATVRELLRNGAAHVAVLDLLNSNGEEAVSKLNEEFGEGKSIFVVCDVSKPRELEAAFARTAKEFGGLDIVINNAGIMNDSKWELMINVNYNAVVRGTLLALDYMSKENNGKGGTVVNVASLVGLTPLQVFPIYSGTKHAIVGFSRSFGQPYHYDKSGVRVLVLCPCVTDTQLISQSGGRVLDIITPEAFEIGFDDTPTQTTESVARGLLHAIRHGDTGSVWVAKGGEPIYEIEIPDEPLKKVPRS